MHGFTLRSPDPYTALVVAVDAAFMRLYLHVRRNARRALRLALALVPLVVLLMGSCKGVPSSPAKMTAAESLRAALFPDRALAMDAGYRPAAGYVSAARGYVADVPEALGLLTDREIGYLFGAPAMTRTDAEARVLQYRGEACVVDFYFYEKGKDAAAMPVSHVDMRRRDGGTAESAACVGNVMSDRAASGA